MGFLILLECLSRNVCRKLPFYAAYYPRRAQSSSTLHNIIASLIICIRGKGKSIINLPKSRILHFETAQQVYYPTHDYNSGSGCCISKEILPRRKYHSLYIWLSDRGGAELANIQAFLMHVVKQMSCT